MGEIGTRCAELCLTLAEMIPLRREFRLYAWYDDDYEEEEEDEVASCIRCKLAQYHDNTAASSKCKARRTAVQTAQHGMELALTHSLTEAQHVRFKLADERRLRGNGGIARGYALL